MSDRTEKLIRDAMVLIAFVSLVAVGRDFLGIGLLVGYVLPAACKDIRSL